MDSGVIVVKLFPLEDTAIFLSLYLSRRGIGILGNSISEYFIVNPEGLFNLERVL
jgi:hypothetical protein